jgi:hypothetical protein
MTDAEVYAAAGLAEQIKPLLAGHRPDIQGAALAELLAIWLAGHRVLNDPAEQARLREELLATHIAAVRELVDVADQEINRRWPGRRK